MHIQTSIPAPDPALLPCPFCGGAPTLEPDPWEGESFRVACANPECRVAPHSEYLLPCFADELRAAWNGRRAADTRRAQR